MKTKTIIIVFLISFIIISSFWSNYYYNDKIEQIEYERDYDKQIFKEYRSDILNSYQERITDWETTRENLDSLDKQKTLFKESN